jgi:hypothetical protein
VAAGGGCWTGGVKIALILIGSLVVFGVALTTTLVTVIGRSRRTAAGDPHLAGTIETTAAHYGGGIDDGMGSVIGNGILGRRAGHPGGLVFVMYVPRRTIDVPASAIRGLHIDPVLRVPGRYAKGRLPWLMVEWVTAQGRTATSGFQVREPERWKSELERQMG